MTNIAPNAIIHNFSSLIHTTQYVDTHYAVRTTQYVDTHYVLVDSK